MKFWIFEQFINACLKLNFKPYKLPVTSQPPKYYHPTFICQKLTPALYGIPPNNPLQITHYHVKIFSVHAYIVLLTRGCSPWRLMNTAVRDNHLLPWIFMGACVTYHHVYFRKTLIILAKNTILGCHHQQMLILTPSFTPALVISHMHVMIEMSNCSMIFTKKNKKLVCTWNEFCQSFTIVKSMYSSMFSLQKS